MELRGTRSAATPSTVWAAVAGDAEGANGSVLGRVKTVGRAARVGRMGVKEEKALVEMELEAGTAGAVNRRLPFVRIPIAPCKIGLLLQLDVPLLTATFLIIFQGLGIGSCWVLTTGEPQIGKMYDRKVAQVKMSQGGDQRVLPQPMCTSGAYDSPIPQAFEGALLLSFCLIDNENASSSPERKSAASSCLSVDSGSSTLANSWQSLATGYEYALLFPIVDNQRHYRTRPKALGFAGALSRMA